MSTVSTMEGMEEKFAFLDRAIDVDTHEMIPFHLWGEYFGEDIAAKLSACGDSPFLSGLGENSNVRPDVVGDVEEITYDTTQILKGCGAPGAIDLRRRNEVMDMQGIEKALVFPGLGLVGYVLASSPEFARAVMALPYSTEECRDLGRSVVTASNEWALRSAEGDEGRRLHTVGLVTTETVEGMIEQARSLIERGIKALWIPSGTPPAGTSPADPAFDPFWKLLADANVPALLHIGTDSDFSNPLWSNNVEAFIPFGSSAEFILSPYAGATMHTAAEYFITTMVLGGVFERFPHLRFGAIELGAQWLGPLARRLNIWANVFPKALQNVLTMKPSEYVARNVRVAPFYFEPIDEFFEQFPEIESSYCFSTDYPHVEGGKEAKRLFAEKLDHLGKDVMEKFFVSNGEWLLP
ncbi:amidohydrolase family protein [Sphingobium sp. EM0848]|uniref:amidohydrolase family protein n=1 Tax=Sphingobium sp. EM0848 TaxID=2743473 RepID=UPI00159C89F5|nr:amidohydrolase family protein [Sphingobium sp. EM0848]